MNMTLKQLRDHHFDGYVGGGPSAAFHKLAVDLLDAFPDGEQVVAYLDPDTQELHSASHIEWSKKHGVDVSDLEPLVRLATPRPAVATEVTEEMVESAAKGMWDSVPRGVEWTKAHEPIAENWRFLARAALSGVFTTQPTTTVATVGDGVLYDAERYKAVHGEKANSKWWGEVMEARDAFATAGDGVTEWRVNVTAETIAEVIENMIGPDGEAMSGTLWLGTAEDCGWEHKAVYGVHLSCNECPEEGSITLAALASPSAPRVGVPEGWEVWRDGDLIQVSSPRGDVIGLLGHEFATRMFRDFCEAMLAAAPEAPEKKAVMPEWADESDKGRFSDSEKFLESYGFAIVVAPESGGV